MKLYDYQQKIFDEVVEKYRTTNKLMMVLPTGGGKTVIFSHLASHFGVKTLIIAHTRELVAQAQKTLHKMHIQNVDVMTIQKVYMSRVNLKEYDFLIVDECHRSCSSSYLEIIESFKNKKLLGVTATPFRADGQFLIPIYGEKIQPLSIIDMINSGLLSDLSGYRVKTKISLKGVASQKGDFIGSKLASVINVSNRNSLIVKESQKIAPGEQSLCFCVDIRHATELTKEFVLKGIKAVAIHGRISKNERTKIINDFRNKKIQILVSCQLLTEGFDEPSITCLLMARPTLSKVLYIQMIGRGCRIFPGKSLCKVIEFTDNEYSVVDLESIFGSTRVTTSLTRGEKISDFVKRVEKEEEGSPDVLVEKFSLMDAALERIPAKPATAWQKTFLNLSNKKYEENISEKEANKMIKEIVNV